MLCPCIPLPLTPGRAPLQNGIKFATLCGANPAQREAALHAFLHDPECAVLTVSGAERCRVAG